jgi:hypothetical protein
VCPSSGEGERNTYSDGSFKKELIPIPGEEFHFPECSVRQCSLEYQTKDEVQRSINSNYSLICCVFVAAGT